MNTKIVDVFEITETNFSKEGNVIYASIVVNLSAADACRITGYVSFDGVFRVTALNAPEVSTASVCIAWLASHEKLIENEIQKHFRAQTIGKVN